MILKDELRSENIYMYMRVHVWLRDLNCGCVLEEGTGLSFHARL